jgi:hypothetical protein
MQQKVPRLINACLARMLCVSVLWLGCAMAWAQSLQAGGFVADPNNGCRVWNPHPQPDESVIWNGPCVDGFAHGAGHLQWLKNNKPYETDEGEWNEGRQQGRGSQDWFFGRYVGEFSGGEPHGRGILTLRTARYEGEFRNGTPNGTGTMTGLDGVFRGTWKNGCLIGDKRKIAIGVPASSCR